MILPAGLEQCRLNIADLLFIAYKYRPSPSSSKHLYPALGISGVKAGVCRGLGDTFLDVELARATVQCHVKFMRRVIKEILEAGNLEQSRWLCTSHISVVVSNNASQFRSFLTHVSSNSCSLNAAPYVCFFPYPSYVMRRIAQCIYHPS